MLKPAILYEDKLNQKLKLIAYDKKYWYYLNNRYCSNNTKFEPCEGHHAFVSIDPKTDDVIGYIHYTINSVTNRVPSIGAIHFEDEDKSGMIFSVDFIRCLMELFELYQFNSVEFSANERNPAVRVYERIIELANGVRLFHTRESTISPDGVICGEVGFEILYNDYMRSKAHKMYMKKFGNEN